MRLMKILAVGASVTAMFLLCSCNALSDVRERTESRSETSEGYVTTYTSESVSVASESVSERVLSKEVVSIALENYGVTYNRWELSYVKPAPQLEVQGWYVYDYNNGDRFNVDKETGDAVFNLFKEMKQFPVRDEGQEQHSAIFVRYEGEERETAITLSEEDNARLWDAVISLKDKEN